MEIGSGTGIVSASAALLGAQVLATDIASVFPILSKNVESHKGVVQSKGGSLETKVLDWSSIHTEGSLHDGHEFDFVLGADLVYCNAQVGPVSEILGFLAGSAKKRCTILIVHKSRDDNIERAFIQCCAQKGLRFCSLEADMVGFEPDSAGSGVLHVYQAIVDVK